MSTEIGRRKRTKSEIPTNCRASVNFHELAFSGIFYKLVFGWFLIYFISNIFNNQGEI